jgi:hypothetical protein
MTQCGIDMKLTVFIYFHVGTADSSLASLTYCRDAMFYFCSKTERVPSLPTEVVQGGIVT